MKDYFKDTLKIKDIKKFINQFDDDDNVLIECCLSDDYHNCLKLSEIKDGEPFQIELCNYDLDDGIRQLVTAYSVIESPWYANY